MIQMQPQQAAIPYSQQSDIAVRVPSKHLEPLLNVNLIYRPEMTAIPSSRCKTNWHIGSGDGTLKGAMIQGRVRWDLYEEIGKGRCETRLTGFIETDDGVEIHFDTFGCFPVPERRQPNTWSTAVALQFETTDQRYEWLNRTAALWDGRFQHEDTPMASESRNGFRV